MKSIMEQASSIMKAVEKAWNRAEQPKEFSIKIFEKEEKNFFGMTTKPAKIGIFFEDTASVPHEKPVAKPRPEAVKQQQKQQSQPTAKVEVQKPTTTAKPHPRAEQPKPEIQKNSNPRPEKQIQEQPKVEQPRRTAVWSDEMINTTQSWLKTTLSLMGMTTISFTQEIAGKNLKLTFNEPLITDIMHEKMLFRSFAHLIMASLRNQYKQEIKDLKVILIRPQ